MRPSEEVLLAIVLVLCSIWLVAVMWAFVVFYGWDEMEIAKIERGCSLEQNLSCTDACTNKLWYDCSEYLGGKNCFVSYCVPCTDPISLFDGQDCPFVYAEKEEFPVYCWQHVPEPGPDLLDEFDAFDEAEEDELY